jgi:MerR family redox-sensitive transcriptional activator SoxR
MLVALRDQLTSCIGCGCLSLRACALYNPADGAANLGSGPRYLLGDTSADVTGG